MENKSDRIQLKIHQWKAKLIDLTKSNRLLNFKDALASNVRINPPLDPIFKIFEEGSKGIIVNQNVDLNRYRPKSKKTQDSQEEEGIFDLDDEEDQEIGANLEKQAINKLESVLNNIRLKAKSHLDERGVNTLYAAFSFLEWTESEDSNIVLKSPLVLVPVYLARNTTKDPYILYRYDDDIILNPTLAHKMRNDFGIDLPEVPDEDIESISRWIKKLSSYFSRQKQWRIVEEIYLASFSFNKLVMYKEFESFEDIFKNNGIVQRLSGLDSPEKELRDSDPICVEEYDSKAKSVSSFQVLDSDSSQLEAIMKAKSGSSFIMHGPPGTGKSQTIANIISEMLALGKKVLFVSEKMAALEVVKKRLEKESLGDFCLELHSHNTNKKAVLQELNRSLQTTKSFSNIKTPFYKLDEVKKGLNQYVKELHTAIHPLGYSPYIIHGELAKLSEVADVNFQIPKINEYDLERVQKIQLLLERFDKQKHLLATYEHHPWKNAKPKRFTLELQANIRANFEALAELLMLLNGLIDKNVKRIDTSWEHTVETIERVLKVHHLLKDKPVFPIKWLHDTQTLEQGQKQLSNFQSLFEIYKKQVEAICTNYQSEVLEQNIPGVYECLTTRYKKDLEKLTKEPFWGQLLMDKSKLLDQLRQLKSILHTIKEHQQFIHDFMGIPIPVLNFNEIEQMLFLYQKLHGFPRPSQAWFDNNNKEDILKFFKDGKTVTTEYLKEKEQLLEAFDSEVLTLDVENLQERFVMNYSSFMRVFKPSYHRDNKMIRHHRKNKKYTYDEMIQDLKLANRVKKKQDYLETEEKRYREYLGPKYQGVDTNWDQLELQIQDFFEIMMDARSQQDSLQRYIMNLTERQVEELHFRYEDLEKAKNELEGCSQDLEPIFNIINPSANKRLDLKQLEQQLVLLENAVSDLGNHKNQILRFAASDYQPSYNQLIDDLKEIQQAIDQRIVIENNQKEMEHIYGELFQGYNTQWSDIHQAIEWTSKLRMLTSPNMTKAFIKYLSESELTIELQNDMELLEAKWKETQELVLFFETVFPRDQELINGHSFTTVHLVNLADRLNEWAENSYLLEEWIQFNEIIDHMNELGLQDFTKQVFMIRSTDYFYEKVFLKRFYKLWLDYAYSKLPALSQFRRMDYEDQLEFFKKLDCEQLSVNGSRLYEKLRLAKSHHLKGSPFGGSEISNLRKEIGKKSRHKPIRRLFSEIPNLLLALKPCMMMSPLSVSQFLDPTIIGFDVVIFDEASQIASEDAIGSIVRGKQVIIAGDNKQLPPTRFFGTSSEVNEEFLDEEDEDIYVNYESILDECAVFLPDKRLKWHYRSKHESLIAFSNQEIYDNELFTFPSSVNGPHDGVSFVHVKEGIYDRSGSRRNMVEAVRVAELVFEHFRKNPKRSLGVIAFSEAQQEAIRAQVDRLRKSNPGFEKFFAEDVQDEFFIKNLENVQGDERDTIIFSVGYGKDQTGNIYYNFGPLNKPGGERRLNVAITRAKYQVILVSSITHSDLDDSKLKKKGPQLLKSYLYYANTGGQFSPNLGILNDGEFDSPLEEDVYNMLASRGLILNKQIGCSSYRIDLAVVDPDHPGEYLLGIECDGASYHSSKTARDRDRLRQEVLESLGWKIHRIWSQDWFKNKKTETDKILEKIMKIKSREKGIEINQ